MGLNIKVKNEVLRNFDCTFSVTCPKSAVTMSAQATANYGALARKRIPNTFDP